MKKIILAAHRGDRAHAPENTLPAYKAAIALGVDGLEVDLHTSLDGVTFMMHDHSFDRTTNGSGPTHEKRWEEIAALDAGAWYGSEFAGTRVPSLEETLQLAADTPELWVNWELKDYPEIVGEELAFQTVRQTIEGIFRYHLEERSMLNSFSSPVLEYAAHLSKGKIQIHGQGVGSTSKMRGPVTRDITEYWDWACVYPIEKGKYPDEREYAECAALGIKPCICLPDTEEIMNRQIQLGCLMFTSNDPKEAIRILKKLGKR